MYVEEANHMLQSFTKIHLVGFPYLHYVHNVHEACVLKLSLLSTLHFKQLGSRGKMDLYMLYTSIESISFPS